MKCGIRDFHQAGFSGDRIVIRDFIQAAEEMGFNHVSVPDHVIQAGTPRGPVHMAPRFTREFPYHETMTLLAFIAGITETIEINSAVIILPQRQTVLVAKQAAEVDVLSGGRLRLGVGLGWNELVFEALGMEFRNRGRRVEEQIEVLRHLWTEELVTFDGEWHQIVDAGLAHDAAAAAHTALDRRQSLEVAVRHPAGSPTVGLSFPVTNRGIKARPTTAFYGRYKSRVDMVNGKPDYGIADRIPALRHESASRSVVDQTVDLTVYTFIEVLELHRSRSVQRRAIYERPNSSRNSRSSRQGKDVIGS